jgi:CTP:molybdopterin cytidylyltransferase MocA
MGASKALVPLEGRPLLEHLLAAPLLREFGAVVVVLGHDAAAVIPVVNRCGYPHVVNPDPDRGRTGSVQVGLEALRPAIRAVFVQPVDCPLVLPETYLALAGGIGPADVAIPRYGGRGGHPPLVSAQLMPRVLAAGADEPLRNLLEAPGVRRRLVDVDDPGVLANVDRPEELEALVALYHARHKRQAETQPET